MSCRPQKQRKRNCLTLQRSLEEGAWNSGPVTLVTFIKGIPGKAAWQLCLSALRDTGFRGTGLSEGQSSSLPHCSHPQRKLGMGVEFYYSGQGGRPQSLRLSIKIPGIESQPPYTACERGKWIPHTSALPLQNGTITVYLKHFNCVCAMWVQWHMPFFFLSVGFYCFIISIQKLNWKGCLEWISQ